jgi:hypothetical protein
MRSFPPPPLSTPLPCPLPLESGGGGGVVGEAKRPKLVSRHIFLDYSFEAGIFVQDEDQVSRLVAEANFYALLSHAYWGVWALVQARYSPIDFDYLEYHHLRMAEFRRRKHEYIDAVLKTRKP